MTKKTLKGLVKNFDTEKPDFSEILPYLTGELKVDLEDFKGNLVGKWGAIQTLWQLSQPEKPKSRSRIWKSSSGYIYLVAWSNASLLRVLSVKWFNHIKSSKNPLTSSKGFSYINRLEAQLLDSLRSTIANIEEGFARPTTSSYLDFLGYSQASLKEAKGDFQRSRQDGFLKSVSGSSLKDIGVDLKDWREALKKTAVSKPSSKVLSNPLKSSKFKGGYGKLKEFKFNYPPVDKLKPQDLTYEIFIELTNKTDWHLRKLVESLEKKLNTDQKGYQVEQARIRSNTKWKN